MGNDFRVTIMSLRFWQLPVPHAKINTRSRNSTSKFPLSTILPYFTISRIITIPKIFPKNTLALKYNENKRVCVKTMSLMKISHGSWSMNIYWLINNRPEKSTVSTRNLRSLREIYGLYNCSIELNPNRTKFTYLKARKESWTTEDVKTWKSFRLMASERNSLRQLEC